MCGIIGRIGEGNSVSYVIEGLKRLEYRGYDSAGIAVVSGEEIIQCKAQGNISYLEEKIDNIKPIGNLCIGHTRWATHGKPNEKNAHPHSSYDGMFTIVHNGIIENSSKLFNDIIGNRDVLKSQTDTEVIAHLLSRYYSGKPLDTIAKVTKILEGSFALGIICKDFPDTLFCTAKASPLVVARGKKGCFIASDSGVLSGFADRYLSVSDGEIAAIRSGEITVFDSCLNILEKKSYLIDSNYTDDGKQGYEHYMMLEIKQQGKAVKDTLSSIIENNDIFFEKVKLTEEYIRNGLKSIVFIACGSAYHAGMVGKNVVESLCGINSSAEIASEFRYSKALVDSSTLAVLISQSGETADTLAALRVAKEKGAKTLSIVNVKESAIAKESQSVIYTLAGREVSVATTKAYSAQLAVIYALAIYIAEKRGVISSGKASDYKKELLSLPKKIDETVSNTEESAKEMAKLLYNQQDIYFIGRQNSYAVSLEASLKMKEISYIHSEAYAAGELKHGTISLIEQGTVVIAIAHNSEVLQKTLSNIAEVKARGAKTILITDNKKIEKNGEIDEIIRVDTTLKEFSPSLLVLPMQLVSYYTAKLRGCDIDKPKNLAKSVTVE